MTKYAYIAILVPIPEGDDWIPKNWFENLPKSAIYAADKLNGQPDLVEVGKGAAWAMDRKVKQDGWPKSA